MPGAAREVNRPWRSARSARPGGGDRVRCGPGAVLRVTEGDGGGGAVCHRGAPLLCRHRRIADRASPLPPWVQSKGGDGQGSAAGRSRTHSLVSAMCGETTPSMYPIPGYAQ
ncbi:hypothetical protein GCM10027186_61000 [Micromonospora schwarzwaldensis]